jgi:hypothetical protein
VHVRLREAGQAGESALGDVPVSNADADLFREAFEQYRKAHSLFLQEIGGR